MATCQTPRARSVPLAQNTCRSVWCGHGCHCQTHSVVAVAAFIEGDVQGKEGGSKGVIPFSLGFWFLGGLFLPCREHDGNRIITIKLGGVPSQNRLSMLRLVGEQKGGLAVGMGATRTYRPMTPRCLYYWWRGNSSGHILRMCSRSRDCRSDSDSDDPIQKKIPVRYRRAAVD